jgi:putative phosphoribosyl transferase
MILKDITKIKLENNISISKKFFLMFSSLGKLRPTFQIKFKDRVLAASILSATVKDKIGKELMLDSNNFVVLGIPRGGVLVADSVATTLGIKYFDIVIPRKLTDIDNKEQAIGAIMEDGTTYIDDMLISDLQLDSSYIEKEKQIQIEEIKRRRFLYRNNDLRQDYNVIDGRTVILIDDGVATGATLIVSARWIKKNYNPKKLIIATPVASKDSLNLLIKECDSIITVTSPKECFYSVEQYYKSFSQIEDSEVIEIMNKWKTNHP